MAAVRVAQIAGGQFEKNSDGARAAGETLDEWSAVAAAGEAVKHGKPASSTNDRRKTRTLLGGLGVKIIEKKETTDGN